MLFTQIAVVVHLAFAVAALPRLDRLWTYNPSLRTVDSQLGFTHRVEASSNTTLTSRAPNYVCTTLELPTEAEYRTGYEDFCNRYVSNDYSFRMGAGAPPLVATYMLRAYSNNLIPWVYRIESTAWGASVYWLRRDKCLAGFRDMLESERAKQGTDYCVVHGTGGDGESKKFWGEGVVLKTESRMDWLQGSENEVSVFETRKRKGKYAPPSR